MIILKPSKVGEPMKVKVIFINQINNKNIKKAY